MKVRLITLVNDIDVRYSKNVDMIRFQEKIKMFDYFRVSVD